MRQPIITNSPSIFKFLQLLGPLCVSLFINNAQASGGGPPIVIPACDAIEYPAPAVGFAPLHVDGEYLKDSAGRVVLLRGVNAPGDAKVPPFTTLNDATQLDPLPGWGVNVIRLLFNWEAFEPTRCHHQESYLQYYEQVVNWAADLGIYVIVDFHQDAYSRYSLGGCGEGFPSWAVSSEVGLKTPNNSAAKCSTWGATMIIDPSHHKTWEKFHKDTEGAKSRYLDMVAAVAQRMSTHDNVIGYELINEPWGTDTELHNLYEAVGYKIRERHPDAVLFVPPHALVSSGAVANNIAKPTFTNFVYSPHFYDASVLLIKAWLGGSPNGALNGMLNKAHQWGVPMLLGEYGAPATTNNGSGYMEALNDWLDAQFVAGTQWNYTPGWTPEKKDGWNGEDLSIVNELGELRDTYTPRPYPTKTSGVPNTFLRVGSGFTYSWENNPALGATEIFLPTGYATGKSLQVTGPAGPSTGCAVMSQKLVCNIAEAGAVQVSLQ